MKRVRRVRFHNISIESNSDGTDYLYWGSNILRFSPKPAKKYAPYVELIDKEGYVSWSAEMKDLENGKCFSFPYCPIIAEQDKEERRKLNAKRKGERKSRKGKEKEETIES